MINALLTLTLFALAGPVALANSSDGPGFWRHSLAECRRWLALLSRAHRSSLNPITANPPHLNDLNVAYLSAWRHRLNPTGRPFRLLNGAIGPDISTPLLATNATEVVGIDRHRFSVPLLKKALEHWAVVDQPTDKLPPVDFKILQWRYRQNGPLTEEALRRDWETSLALRKIRGYWDEGILRPWSHERLLIYELKAMGVSPESIQIEEGANGEVQVRFLWGNSALGIAPQPRLIRFLPADVDSFFSQRRPQEKSFDGYLQKALPIPAASDQSVIANVPQWLTPNGVILYTPDALASESEIQQRNRELEALTSLQLLQGETGLEQQLARYVLQKNSSYTNSSTENSNWQYGWRLFGLQRINLGNALPLPQRINTDN